MNSVIVERIILLIIGLWFILRPTMAYLVVLVTWGGAYGALPALMIKDKVASYTVAYLFWFVCAALVAYGVTLLF